MELLKILKKMSKAERAVLVSILLKKGGFTEELTGNALFRACHEAGDYSPCLDLIATEICKFGGNTFTNLRDGAGPEYKAIAIDVCAKFNIIASPNCRMRDIDAALLDRVLSDMWGNMTDAERREFLLSLGLKLQTDSDLAAEGLAALLVAFRAGGFASYQLAVIVVNAVAKVLVGQGLSLAANAALTKALSIAAGPIGVALTALWVVKDVAGPAYRVTIPVVIYLAAIRQAHRFQRKSRKKAA